jgi:hypothetical protein
MFHVLLVICFAKGINIVITIVILTFRQEIKMTDEKRLDSYGETYHASIKTIISNSCKINNKKRSEITRMGGQTE